MGIRGLIAFLKKRNSSLMIQVPMSSLTGQRLAVDASVYLYKFICMDNQFKGKWLDMFINFILWLRRSNIRPVFIFDGKPPPQKERTQKERRATRHRTEHKMLEFEHLLELVSEYELDEELPADLKHRIDEAIHQDTTYWPRKQVQRELHSRFKKENSKVIHIGPAENERIQNLLTFLGLPWFKAVGEAEKTCAWLCKWDYVKGVITTDSDVLAYGAPIFVKDLHVNDDACHIIRYEDVLDATEMTEEQFLDFCIMCGTDYNKNIPGVGPNRAFDLLHHYYDLDGIAQTTVDTSILYYQEGRELFRLPAKKEASKVIENVSDHLRIPAIKPINSGALKLLLRKYDSRFTVEQIDAQLHIYRPKFVIRKGPIGP